MKSKLIAYALDFASFVIQKKQEDINNIILFGSVSREEAGKKSDIDIFIDVIKSTPYLENELNKIKEQFLSSTKYNNYWRLLNIKNEIKLTIGEINEWKELKPSLVANGILLYGKFKPEVEGGKHKTFFVWENIKPNSKRVLFNKQMMGYKQNGKFYEGLLQKYKGERLGKGCIVVPLEHSNVFLKLLRKYKAKVKIKKILEYN